MNVTNNNVIKKPILILDVGSTSSRAFVIENEGFDIIGSAMFETQLIQNDEGHCEVNPEDFFNNIIKILQEALKSAQVDAKDILCMGISTQRNTFVVVDKITGEPLHQLIYWSDKRSQKSVDEINGNCCFKSFVNGGSKVLYWMTHKNIFKQGINLKIKTEYIAPRLRHILKNNRKLKEAMDADQVALFNIDTWLLNKFKNHNEKSPKLDFVTDITNASSTVLYDIFNDEYNAINLKLFGIKQNMLSTVVSNSHDFGLTNASIFGVPIRISVIISDQSASLIGNTCFGKMDSKVTLGTGTFLDVNTGNKVRGSRNGSNPLVAWSIKHNDETKITYKIERDFHKSSTAIRFAKTIGLCTSEDELSSMAFSVADTNGAIFIPKFDSMAGFLGFKQSTTKSHLVRAILESIVFKAAEFVYLTQEENSDYRPKKIRIDGGISANDFICQSIADLVKIPIERGVNSSQITSIGCAYLAAYNCGQFERLEDAEKFYKIEKVFTPIESNYQELYARFQKFCDIYARCE